MISVGEIASFENSIARPSREVAMLPCFFVGKRSLFFVYYTPQLCQDKERSKEQDKEKGFSRR